MEPRNNYPYSGYNGRYNHNSNYNHNYNYLENALQNRNYSLNDSDEKPATSTARALRNMRNNDEEYKYSQGENNSNLNLNIHMSYHSQGVLQFVDPNEMNAEEEKGLPTEYVDKIKKMRMGRSGRVCSVCYNGFNQGEKIRKLPCNHIFHENCIIPWLQENITCPNCRLNLIEFFNENLEY